MTNSSPYIKNRLDLLAVEGLALTTRAACGRIVLALVRLQHCLLHSTKAHIRPMADAGTFRSVRNSMPRQVKAVKYDYLDVSIDDRLQFA